MKQAAISTIVAAALLLTPAAGLAASSTPHTKVTASTTTTTTTPATTPSTTTPASVPTTSITTSTTGGSSLLLAPRTPANLTSGRTALVAYESYLQTLVGSQAASQADDASYVSTVESGCKSALEPLTQGANEVKPAVQYTLTVLGKEIGDDLAIDYDQVAQTPLAKLAGVLQRLKWVRGGHNQQVIGAYISAETALISLPQSALCQDVLLASTDPKVAPANSHTFLDQYKQSVTTASSALGSFLTLLRAYETSADQPIVQRISALAKQFDQDSKTDLLSAGQQLTTSLETT